MLAMIMVVKGYDNLKQRLGNNALVASAATAQDVHVCCALAPQGCFHVHLLRAG
jgi:hypothetical protein